MKMERSHFDSIKTLNVHANNRQGFRYLLVARSMPVNVSRVGGQAGTQKVYPAILYESGNVLAVSPLTECPPVHLGSGLK